MQINRYYETRPITYDALASNSLFEDDPRLEPEDGVVNCLEVNVEVSGIPIKEAFRLSRSDAFLQDVFGSPGTRSGFYCSFFAVAPNRHVYMTPITDESADNETELIPFINNNYGATEFELKTSQDAKNRRILIPGEVTNDILSARWEQIIDHIRSAELRFDTLEELIESFKG